MDSLGDSPGDHSLMLRVLGCRVRVACSDAQTANLVSRCYSAFLHRAARPQGQTIDYSIERIDAESAWRIRRDRVTYYCASSADLLYDFEKDLTIRLQHRRRTRFFVHGAVVSRHGVGAVIAGRSGAGKSTLCWALCHSGFSYLSDELAPIRPDTCTVEAYPHALCLKADPGDNYPLPPATVNAQATLHVPVECFPSPVELAATDLGVVVFLENGAGTSGKAGARRLCPSEAAARLYANSLNQLSHPHAGLTAAAEIAAAVPSYLVYRQPVADLVALVSALVARQQSAASAGNPRKAVC